PSPDTVPAAKMAQTNPLPVPMGPWKVCPRTPCISPFPGKRMEFTSACPNIMECGFDNIRSVKVECGASPGPEQSLHAACAGLPQLLMGRDSHHPTIPIHARERALPPSHPLLFPPQNHKESKITIFEKDNFIGRQWEISDDYPSLQAMGWANNEYPGYRGYQYVLESDHHGGDYKHWREWGSHAQTSQIQSIRRVQQ
ncbi:Beta-crystallin A3, partial [Gavia stellata]